MYLCKLIRDAVRDVCATGGSAICSQNHSILEIDSHTTGFVSYVPENLNRVSLGWWEVVGRRRRYIEVPRL